MPRPFRFAFFAALLLAGLLLSACQQIAPPDPLVTPSSVPAETALPGGTLQPGDPTALPTSTSQPERTLVVCLAQEPETLYPYGGSSSAQQVILEAVYDGPIDSRSYSYQPVILEKLPSLADGDAQLSPVDVATGDRVVNEDGLVVPLGEGVRVRPAGCQSADCAIAYDGESTLQMDRLTVEFKLLPGLLWSDGIPLTARDSVYAYELAAQPETPTRRFAFIQQRTASYTALDDLRTVWTGLPGYLDETFFLNFWMPLPEHLWGNTSAADLAQLDLSRKQPLGYGAYMIQEWVSGVQVSLVKNPNYFRAGEGLPKFDRLLVNFLGQNATVEAIQTGECDIVLDNIYLDAQLEQVETLTSSGEISAAFGVDGASWDQLDFNLRPAADLLNSGLFAGWDRDGDGLGPFADVRLRQAVALCLDRQSVVDQVFSGKAALLDGILAEEHPLFNPEITYWAFDANAGGELLEQTGWQDRDGNGVREAYGILGVPDGTPLSFTYLTTTAEGASQAAQLFADSLQSCGIQAKLESLPAAELFLEGPDGRLFGRRFDVAQFAWLTGIEPYCDLYTSRNIPGPGDALDLSGEPLYPLAWGGLNLTGYSSPDYDRACATARLSIPGQPAYAEALAQLQAQLSADLPVIPLYQPYRLVVARPELCGFSVDSTARSLLWNVENLDYGAGCE